MQTTSNVIDKNWKALIKPNKLDITSNEDKTIANAIITFGTDIIFIFHLQ